MIAKVGKAIIVHSHKEVERYEVSADTKGLMESLKKNLINNSGMELKKEWMDLYEGKFSSLLCLNP